jgi:hypothetical protein
MLNAEMAQVEDIRVWFFVTLCGLVLRRRYGNVSCAKERSSVVRSSMHRKDGWSATLAKRHKRSLGAECSFESTQNYVEAWSTGSVLCIMGIQLESQFLQV